MECTPESGLHEEVKPRVRKRTGWSWAEKGFTEVISCY